MIKTTIVKGDILKEVEVMKVKDGMIYTIDKNDVIRIFNKCNLFECIPRSILGECYRIKLTPQLSSIARLRIWMK